MDKGGAKRGGGWLAVFFASLLALPLGFCGYVKWREPRSMLPAEVQWSEVLAFNSTFGLREGCSFGVYRLSDSARFALLRGGKLPGGWWPSPLALIDDRHADLAPLGRQITLHADSAVTCASDTARRFRLVEGYEDAMREKGNWVRILNGGEALVLVAPRRGLIWYLNFG